MNASNSPHLMHGKRMHVGKSRKAIRSSKDRSESRLVRLRSEGRCEVLFEPDGRHHDDPRCNFMASQVHHMIGGRGRRGIGISALKEHKQHVCDDCHRDITGDVGGKKLIRQGGAVPMWTDHYRRVR